MRRKPSGKTHPHKSPPPSTRTDRKSSDAGAAYIFGSLSPLPLSDFGVLWNEVTLLSRTKNYGCALEQVRAHSAGYV